MQNKWDRNEVIQLLSLSGTLAGLSITGLTVFRKSNKANLVVTIGDDLLAFAALCFLLSTYLLFFSLRVSTPKRAMQLENIGDALFLIALTSMVSSGFVMLYTLW